MGHVEGHKKTVHRIQLCSIRDESFSMMTKTKFFRDSETFGSSADPLTALFRILTRVWLSRGTPLIANYRFYVTPQ